MPFRRQEKTAEDQRRDAWLVDSFTGQASERVVCVYEALSVAMGAAADAFPQEGRRRRLATTESFSYVSARNRRSGHEQID